MTVFHLCTRRFTANKNKKEICSNSGLRFDYQEWQPPFCQPAKWPNGQLLYWQACERRPHVACSALRVRVMHIKNVCVCVCVRVCMCAAVIKLAMQTHVFYENRLFGMDLGGTVSVQPNQPQLPIPVPVPIPVPSSSTRFIFSLSICLTKKFSVCHNYFLCNTFAVAVNADLWVLS